MKSLDCSMSVFLWSWTLRLKSQNPNNWDIPFMIEYNRCRWAWWSSPPTTQGRLGAWRSCISWCKTGRGHKSSPFSMTWLRVMFGAQARGPWRKGGPRRRAVYPRIPRISIKAPSRPLPTLWAGSIPAADTCKKSVYTRVFYMFGRVFMWVDLVSITDKLLPSWMPRSLIHLVGVELAIWIRSPWDAWCPHHHVYLKIFKQRRDVFSPFTKW